MRRGCEAEDGGEFLLKGENKVLERGEHSACDGKQRKKAKQGLL